MYQRENCQKNKLIETGYGLLPPGEAPFMPWSEVMVDLIGLWRIQIIDEDIFFNTLTCIYPVKNLVEIIRRENKIVDHAARKFKAC